jgi:hypothetical protein
MAKSGLDHWADPASPVPASLPPSWGLLRLFIRYSMQDCYGKMEYSSSIFFILGLL